MGTETAQVPAEREKRQMQETLKGHKNRERLRPRDGRSELKHSQRPDTLQRGGGGVSKQRTEGFP